MRKTSKKAMKKRLLEFDLALSPLAFGSFMTAIFCLIYFFNFSLVVRGELLAKEANVFWHQSMMRKLEAGGP